MSSRATVRVPTIPHEVVWLACKLNWLGIGVSPVFGVAPDHEWRRGIRTLDGSIESATYRFLVAGSAIFATAAVARCPNCPKLEQATL
jgi:hypothetical protein